MALRQRHTTLINRRPTISRLGLRVHPLLSTRRRRWRALLRQRMPMGPVQSYPFTDSGATTSRLASEVRVGGMRGDKGLSLR